MTGPYGLTAAHDPAAPADSGTITVTVDGEAVTGRAGQTIAGMLLASGRVSWRVSPRSGRPRGVFCGIGVCFDCLLVVNGLPDVRACQRRATDGDVIDLQDDSAAREGHAARDGDGRDRRAALDSRGDRDGRGERGERASAGDGR
ncbi:(2Fe-2S)-binding protein [Catenuloplanes sp. NPDC051500]|uniref:(2Fe-2S)-binding protein n=1 Tax=Catenuloplanes sp. NPDC051500 TaxID=3363959 RepID=UPI00378726B0